MVAKLTVSEKNLIQLISDVPGLKFKHLNEVDREVELDDMQKYHIQKALTEHIDLMNTSTYKMNMIDMIQEEYKDENIKITQDQVFNLASNNIKSATIFAKNTLLKVI